MTRSHTGHPYNQPALNPGSEFQAFQLSERLAQSYIERLTNYEVLTQSILIA
jgi:hypothetical protein